MASDPCAYQDCRSEGDAGLGVKILVIGVVGGGVVALLGYLWAIRSRRRVVELMPLGGLAITSTSVVLGALAVAPTV
ncbi:hypothetical protein EF294_13780 [Gordonia oryzae]|uniref:Uncharacterized protein n=1 Tax=Gordonia oryzae TaxID=2487349 RepID=A0A3N4GLR7_9ACTN|nr:hypothetical protein EF294_13780 [Gordonia oryzae]